MPKRKRGSTDDMSTTVTRESHLAALEEQRNSHRNEMRSFQNLLTVVKEERALFSDTIKRQCVRINQLHTRNAELQRMLQIVCGASALATRVVRVAARRPPPLFEVITAMMSEHSDSIGALQRGETLDADAFHALRHACLDTWDDQSVEEARETADAVDRLKSSVWKHMPEALAAWNGREGRLDESKKSVTCGILLSEVPVSHATCMPCCGAYFATNELGKAVRVKSTCPACRKPLRVLFTPKEKLPLELRRFGI